MTYEILKSHKSFAGDTVFASHQSAITKTSMSFSYFKPERQVRRVILWLSGLTCNEENFMTKAGAQALLADGETLIVCPDTSPRGLDLPSEHDSYDFGSGAGFYLNATTSGYKDHYRMYDYLLDEFMPLISGAFGVSSWVISGHSMGGHGALVLGLRNPDKFSKISAFSPIVNPTKVPWGLKAFQGYLADDEASWRCYDACELVKDGFKHPQPILIEQGLDDDFFETQLKTQNFESVCREQSQDLKVQYRSGYDHSYYFISSFLASHIEYLCS